MAFTWSWDSAGSGLTPCADECHHNQAAVLESCKVVPLLTSGSQDVRRVLTSPWQEGLAAPKPCVQTPRCVLNTCCPDGPGGGAYRLHHDKGHTCLQPNRCGGQWLSHMAGH